MQAIRSIRETIGLIRCGQCESMVSLPCILLWWSWWILWGLWR
jgi:hypothetical protein